MADDVETSQEGVAGMRRRDFIKRSAAAGALAWAAPQILTAHPAAAAGSPGPCEEVFSDDFEGYEDQVPDGGYTTIPNGETFGEWEVTQGNVDLIRNNYGACDGVAVDLFGTDNGPGRIETTVLTDDTELYTLRFDLGQNGAGNGLLIHIGGTSFQIPPSDVPSQGKCEQQTLTFTPSLGSTDTTIGFEDLNPAGSQDDNGGAVIDNVVVELCPDA